MADILNTDSNTDSNTEVIPAEDITNIITMVTVTLPIQEWDSPMATVPNDPMVSSSVANNWPLCWPLILPWPNSFIPYP
jgi:hypothetical protein